MSLMAVFLVLAQEVSFEEKLLGVVPEGDHLEDKAFSADGRAVFFRARKPHRRFVVVGDKRGEAFDWVIGITLNARGIVAYRAQKGAQEFVVVGEKKGPAFDEV